MPGLDSNHGPRWNGPGQLFPKGCRSSNRQNGIQTSPDEGNTYYKVISSSDLQGMALKISVVSLKTKLT